MWNKIRNFLSGCYVVAAFCLLLAVCCHCYPNLEAWGRELLSGREDSPVKAAFSVLSEELGQGTSLKESVLRSYEALTGEETTD